MTAYVLGAALVVGVAYLLFRRLAAPGVREAVDAAIAAQDATPVVEAAARLDASRQADFYEQAIVLMWGEWQRSLAIRVIKVFAIGHSGSRICQYWLRQAMEVEPAVARQELDEEFLSQHYDPEVAACCGKSS